MLKDLKVRFSLKVLMLSMHDEALRPAALRAGASGYIMFTRRRKRFIRHPLSVEGEIYVSERWDESSAQQFRRQITEARRSVEDGDRVAGVQSDWRRQGTRQIAEMLHLSIKTIESHRAHIKEKLGLNNASELVQHAIQCANSELSGSASSAMPIPQGVSQAV
jgi:DNA-binding NarL/FixJ family response regulator